MLNRLIAEFVFFKDVQKKRNYKINSKKIFSVNFIAYFVLAGILGGYIIFRLFLYVDNNTDVNKFKIEKNPDVIGQFIVANNDTYFAARQYKINIGNINTIEDVSDNKEQKIKLLLDGSNEFFITFDNSSAKNSLIKGIKDNYKGYIPHRNIEFK